MRRTAGATTSAKVTAALTGFPGKPNARTGFFCFFFVELSSRLVTILGPILGIRP
jgi:hypothetical protein